MLALTYLIAGLIMVVAGVILLAGPEWGVLSAGGLLVGLAVFEQRGTG